MSVTSRKAFEAAVFGLVQDLPRTPSSVIVRRDEASLTSSIQQTQGVIGKTTARITGLEAEVQTLSTALTAKKTEADDLLRTQTAFQSALATALAAKQRSFETSLLFAMLGSWSNTATVTVAATANGINTAYTSRTPRRRSRR